jgi:uncharacterized coiled-coil protein SlyX
MTWQYDDNDNDYEPPEEPKDKRRAPFVVVGAFVLATIGSGSAFAWRAYGGSPYPSFALGSSSAGSGEPKTVGLDEFRAFQQQIAGQMQSNAQVLAAQQAEVKRLFDQMTAVSTKMDAIQSSIASARAAIPATTPPTPKKAAKPKPSARISTGGAPLPPPIQLTR